VALFRNYLRALAMLSEHVRTAMVLSLANLAIAGVQLYEAVLFGLVVDALSAGRPAFGVISTWALLGVFSIFASVAVSLVADRLAHRNRLFAMNRVFERTITLPLTYLSERGTGRIVRIILLGGDTLFVLWLTFFREHLVAILSISLLVPIAIIMNFWLAMVLFALALLYAIVNVFVVARTEGGQSAVEQYNQALSSRVGDVIGNVGVVQAFARLESEAVALKDISAQLLAAQFPVLNWWALLTVLTRAAATIAMVSIFATGSVLVAAGEVTVGEVVAFVGFAGLLITRLDQLAGFVGRLFMQAPVLSALYELLDSADAVGDRPDAVDLADVAGHVTFENVSYRFPGTDLGIFDISFDIAPGQTVALVGPTGSGKTTMLALLQRLRDPDRGTIKIDGHDIRDLTLSSLRHSMAVVFQDAGLFNRSIADNLRVGSADTSDADLIRVARAAEALDFIDTKPGRFNFVIGERGALLSGGERQRLAIARAMLKAAPILLLDEATSALDAETEARIKLAIDQARRGRTTFIIAHRLSTVTDADLIFVLAGGRIVERGTFEDLMRAGGPFTRLATAGGFPSSQGTKMSAG
jgi:glucan exporter ATP-binding protein